MNGSSRWLVLAMRVGAALAVLAMLGGMVRCYVPAPYWDDWDGYVDFLERLRGGDLAAWWRPHNEHRIVLARALFWLDVQIGERFVVPLVANAVLVLLSAALFARALRRRLPGDGDAPLRSVLAAIVTIALCSWIQRPNLVWGFQVQFFLALALPLLGLVLLASRSSTTPRTGVAIAGGCGVLALGTMASGIFALPVMAIGAAAMRLRRSTVLVFAILAIAGGGLYLHGVEAGGGATWRAFVERPLAPMWFLLAFLGGPVHYLMMALPGCAEVGGVLFLWLFGRAVRQNLRRDAEPMGIAMTAFSGYVLLTAVAAAIGRGSEGMESPLAQRYATPMLYGWCALLVAHAPELVATGRRRPRVAVVAIVLVVAAFTSQQVKALLSNRVHRSERNISSLALELDVRDAEVMRRVYPDDRVFDLARPARDRDSYQFGHWPLRGLHEAIGESRPAGTEVRLARPLQRRDLAGQSFAAVAAAFLPGDPVRAVWLVDAHGVARGFALAMPGMPGNELAGYVSADVEVATLRAIDAGDGR